MASSPGEPPQSPSAGHHPAGVEGAAKRGDGEVVSSSVRQLLAQDPFLLYLDETDELYHVRHGAGSALQVAKDRAIPELYPAVRPALLHQAYRWLWLALFGLLLAGLGAMLFATLAAFAALGLNLSPISPSDRVRSLVVLILSGGLWLGGLLLAVIFLVHLL